MLEVLASEAVGDIGHSMSITMLSIGGGVDIVRAVDWFVDGQREG